MEVMNAICARKSVRSYTGECISKEELDVILKAAYAAPVGMGKFDTLQLTVITNKELLAKIDAAGAKFFGNPDMHPLYGGPMLIVVSSAMTGTPADSVAMANATCLVENMALAAVDMGIGTCHIWGAINALKQSPELATELNLPESYLPCCAILLGKTNDEYTVREIPSEKIKTAYIE